MLPSDTPAPPVVMQLTYFRSDHIALTDSDHNAIKSKKVVLWYVKKLVMFYNHKSNMVQVLFQLFKCQYFQRYVYRHTEVALTLVISLCFNIHQTLNNFTPTQSGWIIHLVGLPYQYQIKKKQLLHYEKGTGRKLKNLWFRHLSETEPKYIVIRQAGGYFFKKIKMIIVHQTFRMMGDELQL